jgi:hypothetical protein
METVASQFTCGDGSYCFKKQWHGTFSEHLSLRQFPMDIQKLTFIFASEWPEDKVQFKRCNSHASTVSGLGFQLIRDVWTPTMLQDSKGCQQVAIRVREDIFEGSGFEGSNVSSPYATGLFPTHSCQPLRGFEGSNADKKTEYPKIEFTFQLRRSAANYLWNIIMPTCTMVTLSFMSFTVPLDEVADRASITLTLLLAIIAYKLIIKDELPKVSFLTLIDKYILASMSIVATIGFVNSALGSNVDQVTESLKSTDKHLKWILGTAWVLCNVYFMLLVLYRLFHARDKVRKFQNECTGTVAQGKADVLYCERYNGPFEGP